MYSLKLFFTVALIMLICKISAQHELEVEGSALINGTIISDDPDIGIRLIPQKQCSGLISELGISIYRDSLFIGDDFRGNSKKSINDCSPDYDDRVLRVEPQNYSNNIAIRSFFGSQENAWDFIYGKSFNGNNFKGTGTITADGYLISNLGVRTKNSIAFTSGTDSGIDDGANDDGLITASSLNSADIAIMSKDDIILQIHGNNFGQGEGEFRVTNLDQDVLFKTSDDGNIFAPNIGIRNSAAGTFELQYDPVTGEIFALSISDRQPNVNGLKQATILNDILTRLDEQEKEITSLKQENKQLKKLNNLKLN